MITGKMEYAAVQIFKKGHRLEGKAAIYALFHLQRSAESFVKHMNRVNSYPSEFKAVRLPCEVEGAIDPAEVFEECGDLGGDEHREKEGVIKYELYAEAIEKKASRGSDGTMKKWR